MLTGYLKPGERITDTRCELSPIDLLRRLHRATGLTQIEVGKRLGCSDEFVSMFLSMTCLQPEPETLQRFASVYGPGVYVAYRLPAIELWTLPEPRHCPVCGRAVLDSVDFRSRTCGRVFCLRVRNARRYTSCSQRRQAATEASQ